MHSTSASFLLSARAFGPTGNTLMTNGCWFGSQIGVGLYLFTTKHLRNADLFQRIAYRSVNRVRSSTDFALLLQFFRFDHFQRWKRVGHVCPSFRLSRSARTSSPRRLVNQCGDPAHRPTLHQSHRSNLRYRSLPTLLIAMQRSRSPRFAFFERLFCQM